MMMGAIASLLVTVSGRALDGPRPTSDSDANFERLVPGHQFTRLGAVRCHHVQSRRLTLQ